MKLYKKFLVICVLAFSAIASGFGNTQIGYVDGERVMKEAPQVQKVLEEGKQKIEAVQKEAEEELAKKTDMTPEELAKAQADIQRKVMGMNQAYATQLKAKLDVAMQEISKAKNLDVVIDNSNSQKLIFMGGVDVTDEVIQKLQ